MSKDFNIIFASTDKGGIGTDTGLPWKSSDDMKYFKQVTTHVPYGLRLQNVIIMGRKTFESLPVKPLPGRINIVITSHKNKYEKTYPNIIFCDSFSDSISMLQTLKHYCAWVIGGKSIYNQALKHHLLYNVYHNTILREDTPSTVFLRLPKMVTSILDKGKQIRYYKSKVNDNEIRYANLLTDVLMNGNLKKGRNGNVLSVFSKDIFLDVEHSFPLLTCKKMFWRGIVEELLFFIRGQTDTKILENKKIRIWKGNTNKEFLKDMKLEYREGDMGPMYGYQWRHFGATYEGCDAEYKQKGIDQLKRVIDKIKTDPNSRRHLISSFDPKNVGQGVLYPCHSLVLQFYVEEQKYLSVKMYQRSADNFLGVPFNIASTSLLLYIISKLTNLVPKHVHITFGDVHIYEQHISAVHTYLTRDIHKAPIVQIPDFKTIESVETSTIHDYKLINYTCEPSIKAKMVA